MFSNLYLYKNRYAKHTPSSLKYKKKKNNFFLIRNVRKFQLILAHLMLLFLKYHSFSWGFSYNDSFLFLIQIPMKDEFRKK